jgi:hypothetical protein
MRTLALLIGVMSALAAFTFLGSSAHAFDLTGAWATDTSVCEKVFVKTGSKISLRQDSDLYGGGFVVDGRQIIGQIAKCNIKSTKDDGDSIKLIAACSTGVMISDQQYTVKVVNDNQITLSSPGPIDMSTGYVRCPF